MLFNLIAVEIAAVNNQLDEKRMENRIHFQN